MRTFFDVVRHYWREARIKALDRVVVQCTAKRAALKKRAQQAQADRDALL